MVYIQFTDLSVPFIQSTEFWCKELGKKGAASRHTGAALYLFLHEARAAGLLEAHADLHEASAAGLLLEARVSGLLEASAAGLLEANAALHEASAAGLKETSAALQETGAAGTTRKPKLLDQDNLLACRGALPVGARPCACFST
eukprot:scaffold142493_cov16-Tisochrysis_lutea.AAC.1